jgi:hypothetical protein
MRTFPVAYNWSMVTNGGGGAEVLDHEMEHMILG